MRDVLAWGLCIFVLIEANYPSLSPSSQLTIFLTCSLMLCFLFFPVNSGKLGCRWIDPILLFSAGVCGGYLTSQGERVFKIFWWGGQSLGHRAGRETSLDLVIGIVGLILVIEATRRSLGWALPILAGVFLLYAYIGPSLPDWMLPHRGYSFSRLVTQTYLQSQGVFGVALRVMFTYVFLFVLFGTLLEVTGATAFIISLARRFFRNSPGGPAKVAVVASGLMGSLSGSAVANTATTGTFTIPLMKSSGFRPRVAAAIEAAASSGGALAPPVMGAAAYMMLEIISPAVTYLEIVRSALIPACLYYYSLLLLVHLFTYREGVHLVQKRERRTVASSWSWEGCVFFGSVVLLVTVLMMGFTPFRAVTWAMLGCVVLAAGSSRTRVGLVTLKKSFLKTARGAVPLVCAAACVGIVIGVVTLTGVGVRLPSLILPLAENNLLAALLLMMCAAIILGMGLPSAICYLVMATLIGPALGELGVVPLAAHFFIFYFGLMSMVTPPVALAAYTAATIAGSNIMKTGIMAFRFALVGFTLPFMFVFNPQLLLLTATGATPSVIEVLREVVLAALGILSLAVVLAGFLFSRTNLLVRSVFMVSAMLLLYPFTSAGVWERIVVQGVGVLLLVFSVLHNWHARRSIA